MRECGSNVLILRLGKIFDLKPGGGTLLDEMAGKLVRGEKIKAAGDQIFCPTHVDDLVNIILTLLSTDLSGILHLCAPSGISRYDLALRVCRTFGCDETLVQEISLHDLGETFVRPLDTSMRCPRLAQCMDYRFRPLDDCIENLKSGYSEIYS
jgi:dTDP-4-dehydrorhamnose reductase